MLEWLSISWHLYLAIFVVVDIIAIIAISIILHKMKEEEFLDSLPRYISFYKNGKKYTGRSIK